MSLSEIIKLNIEKTISLYIDNISKKFNIDKNELHKLWNLSELESEPIKDKEIVQLNSSIKSSLTSLSKNELVEICKSKGLKITGTKADLIQSITNMDIKTKLEKTSPQKKVSPKTLSKSVIKKLVDKIPNIVIKRNKFNNLEHEESNLVFDNKTQKVYGTQKIDGSVANLTKDDIDICNKYKFQYYIPDNLDQKNDDVEVDELDDDDCDVEIEEIEDVVDEDELEDDFEDEFEEEEEEFEEE